MTLKKKPFLIGIAGGSGSGKTTVVSELRKLIGTKNVVCLSHDYYYRDQTDIPMKTRVKTNYDHPLSLETELLVQHLQQLSRGESVNIPQYDFAQNTRAKKTKRVRPAKVIIVEGILIFESKPLRELFDLRIFVDTEADIRLARRMQRDVEERGRTYEYCLKQYLEFTRPMHYEFVEPNKKFADVIFPEGMKLPAVDILLAKVLAEMKRR